MKAVCSLQQGAIPRTLIPQLEAAVRQAYTKHFPATALTVVWCEIPRGQAYTEGRLADGAWLMIEVADGVAQPVREAAMRGIATAFARVAGVRVDRLMVTVCDSALFSEYLAVNRRRLRPFARLVFTVRTIVAVLASRRRDGFASIAVDY